MMRKIISFAIFVSILCGSVWAIESQSTSEVRFTGKQYVVCRFSEDEMLNGNMTASTPSREFKLNNFHYACERFFLNCQIRQIKAVEIILTVEPLKECDIDTFEYIPNGDTLSWSNISESEEWDNKVAVSSNSGPYTLIKESGPDSMPRYYTFEFVLQVDENEEPKTKAYYSSALKVEVKDNS